VALRQPVRVGQLGLHFVVEVARTEQGVPVYWFSENRKNAFERLARVSGLRGSLITL
jgi:hypothetical protein